MGVRARLCVRRVDLVVADSDVFWGLWVRERPLLLRMCARWLGRHHQEAEDILSRGALRAVRALRNERRAEQEAASARVAAQVSRDSVRLAAAGHVDDPALQLAYLREVEVDDTRSIAAATLAAWSSGALAGLTAPRKSIRLTHASRVERVALRPDGGLAATAADDDFVRLWDPGRPTAPLRLLPHEGEVHAIAFSPDGLRLATATDRGVWLWDARVEARRTGSSTRRRCGRSRSPATADRSSPATTTG